MPSRKVSKDRSAIRKSRHVESETNDGDEASSRSSTGAMEEQSRESSKVERVTSESPRKKQRKNDDNDSYFSNERQSTETRRKKEGKLSYEDYDYDEEEEDASAHKHNKKRRKSERGNNSSNGSVDNSSVSTKKKSQKSKRRSKQEKLEELPIAEILRKAQEEQRTKYEDPAPLPKLTADTIYVQGRNGFNPVKIISSNKNSKTGPNFAHRSSRSRPIRIAVIFQRFWRTVGSICQGLLGGIALLHLILMKTYFSDTEYFGTNYSIFSEIHTSVLSFLMAMALIGTFDKFDLGHIGKNRWREIFRKRFKSVLAIPLYITAFVLHQMTAKVDDKLTLVHYNSSNITYTYPVDSLNETGNFEPDEIKMWNKLSLSKDIIVVLGWIFASVDNQKDMFLGHLEEMNSYMQKT